MKPRQTSCSPASCAIRQEARIQGSKAMGNHWNNSIARLRNTWLNTSLANPAAQRTFQTWKIHIPLWNSSLFNMVCYLARYSSCFMCSQGPNWLESVKPLRWGVYCPFKPMLLDNAWLSSFWWMFFFSKQQQTWHPKHWLPYEVFLNLFSTQWSLFAARANNAV